MLLATSKAHKFLECFTKKEQQKAKQKEFKNEKVIKKKSDKLYNKWKDYKSYFSSQIDKSFKA